MSARALALAAALGGATLLVAGLPRAAAAEPVVAASSQPFSARYQVLRNGRALGEARFTLARGSDDTWRFDNDTRGTHGLAALAGIEIHERSTFRWRGLVPELVAYDYRQSAALRQRERSLRVDATDNAIVSRQDGETWHLRFEEGVADRHAVLLGLVATVASGRADLTFRVADRDDVESQRYRIAGRERVTVPAGQFDTVRIERIREKPGRETDTWLAPALGHLPVRILHREPNGDSLELRLVAHDLDTARVGPPPG